VQGLVEAVKRPDWGRTEGWEQGSTEGLIDRQPGRAVKGGMSSYEGYFAQTRLSSLGLHEQKNFLKNNTLSL
jgi:hypothetical protein